MSRTVRVGIVGGGISGLGVSYFLNREASARGLELELNLIERSDHLGGVIRTERIEDYVLEAGPESFVTAKPGALELVDELGLSPWLAGSNDKHRTVFVVHNRKLVPLPSGMAFLAPVRWRPFWASELLGATGKLRAMFEPFVRPSDTDLSIQAFLQRRLGSQLTERVAEPLVSAIFGGDIARLSASSCLGEFRALEQKFGSLWKGLRARNGQDGSAGPAFMTFRHGMSQLTDRLAKRSGGSVYRNVEQGRVHLRSDHYVLQGSGFQGDFDVLVVCTPAAEAAALLESADAQIAGLLRQIAYTSTTLVYLAYKRSEFSHSLNGFGFVLPRREAAVFDACTWVSSKFDGRCPPETVLLRCAIHDGRRVRSAMSDQETVENVHQEVRQLLGISCAPVFCRVFHALGAMPQMTVGHDQRIRQIEETLGRYPGLFLSSAFSGGVGIPGCIQTARKTAASVLRFLETR